VCPSSAIRLRRILSVFVLIDQPSTQSRSIRTLFRDLESKFLFPPFSETCTSLPSRFASADTAGLTPPNRNSHAIQDWRIICIHPVRTDNYRPALCRFCRTSPELNALKTFMQVRQQTDTVWSLDKLAWDWNKRITKKFEYLSDL